MWRIGKLAQATGLTVRTLHHYEQMGLLHPSRSESRHRFYETKDIQKLLKILALKDIGLSLEEIKQTLEQDQESLGVILANLLEKTKDEITRLSKLQMNLEYIQPLIEQKSDPECLIAVIEALSRIERHIAKQSTIPRDHPNIEAKWRALGQELRTCMKTSTPHSDKTQIVIKKIVAELNQFASGDEDVLAALANLRHLSPPQQLAGWDPPLFQFLDAALLTHKKGY